MLLTPVLADLLINGNLGFLKIGSDIEEVLKFLGCSDRFETIDQLLSKFEKYRIHPKSRSFPLKYGLLEILVSYKSRKVIFYKIYYEDDEDRIIPSILDDGWVSILDGISRQQLKNILLEYNLPSKRILYNAKIDSLLTQIWIQKSGVKINFDTSDGADSLALVAKSGLELAPSNPCENGKCDEFT